jgi:hypothetical protein
VGYRRRRSYERNYGLEAAKRHIADAHAFSVEVGQTDEVVKAAFFSLPGASLNNLFTRYGEIYGEAAADYARETFPKWKRFWQQQMSGRYHRWTPDAVQMSGTVAERLFALLPPLLPIREKHKIVEAIWKAYGPRSDKYVYLGPDSNLESVVAAIRDHFAHQNVQYAIPRNLEARFDWLSDNDVTVKQRLLNYFMDEQRKAAIASARLNIPMMIEQMTGESAAQISKLSHTVFVGNHLVEIKADPLRTGYLLSNSPNDAIRPPVKVPWAGLGIAAAIVGGLFVIAGELNHPTSFPTQQSVTQTYQQPVQQPVPISPTSPPHLASIPPVTRAAPPQPVRTRDSHGAPPAAPSRSTTIATQRAPVNGCESLQIASVSGDGSEVVISNGNRYAIADDLMKVTASNWATGDSVVICSTADATSLKVGYSNAEASAAGSTPVEAGSCSRLYIGYSAPDGSDVGTTDGSIFQVVENDLLRVTASNWTTGQPATVCTARHDGIWYASVRVGYSQAQTTMRTRGSGQTVEPSCSNSMVDGSGSGRLRVGGGSYRVDNDLMQVTAQQFTTGDPVVVCKYSAGGVTHASIARGYSTVQATEL